ncbi:hypothetical protein [Mycetocola zhadangensis]|nr:hypothetical protein [Mycetocola zhadangensis]
MNTSQLPYAAPELASFEDSAVGYLKRRSFLVVFTLPGLVIAGAGATWVLISAALRENIESGLIMTGMGLAMAAIGWLATLPMRFSRKPPTPIRWTEEMERWAWGWPLALGIVTALVIAGGAALVLFAPLGREPGRIALVASIAAYPASMWVGLLYIKHLRLRRNENYARWLAKRAR